MICCFFGDSLTAGVGDPLALGWPGRLVAQARQAGSALVGYNLGVRRNHSLAIRERMGREARCRVFADWPMALVFCFGVVDAAPGFGLPLEETLVHAAAILDEARSLGATRVLGPPPAADPAWDARLVLLSDALARLCQEKGAPFLDLGRPLRACATYLPEIAAGDGIHPGQAGYERLFQTISEWNDWRNLFP